MDRRKVYIDFLDLGIRRVKTEEALFRILGERFDLQLTDTPDYLVHAHDAEVHRLYTCKKIFWTSENYAPDFRESDYALTCHYLEDPRHLRYPLYARWAEPERLLKVPGEAEAVMGEKSKFCCFFTSYVNEKTEHRINFFKKLSQYRQVDSAGKAMNNIGVNVPFELEAKIKFLRPYKFYLAFENSSVPGYTTEKICEAMLARCIPIYWGNPRVAEDFNPKSFLNYHDFPSEEALIERIMEIDRDDNLFAQYLNEPFFHGNQLNECFSKDRVLDFFEKIFADTGPAVSARKKHFLFGRWMLVKRNKNHRHSALPE